MLDPYWKLQFFSTFDWFNLAVAALLLFGALVGFVASCWGFFRAMPLNTSAFAESVYKANWMARSRPYDQLSPSTIAFLRDLDEGEEARVKAALGYMLLTRKVDLLNDLAFSAKVSEAQAIIPFSRDYQLGDGQFTLESEFEFLIDRNLVRQMPVPLSVAPNQDLPLFIRDHLIVVRGGSAGATLWAYVATTLGKELLFAGEGLDRNYEMMVRRLKTRVFKDKTILHGGYKVVQRQPGVFGVDPVNLVEYTPPPL